MTRTLTILLLIVLFSCNKRLEPATGQRVNTYEEDCMCAMKKGFDSVDYLIKVKRIYIGSFTITHGKCSLPVSWEVWW